MQRRTESELVTLARAGNKQAFSELVTCYQAIALQIARSIVNQEEIARELVQEAFLAAYLCLHQLRDEQRFKSWLYGIILNTCRSYLRSQKSNTYSLEALLGGSQADLLVSPDFLLDPQEIAEERELYRRVQQAIQALAPGERIATLLFYYEQLSIREIATLLHISETAVKSRLFQARKRLAKSRLADKTTADKPEGEN